MKRLWYILLFLGVVLTSCHLRPKESFTRQALRVKTITVDSILTSVTHTYVGQVEESHHIPMSFTAGGKILSIRVHNGQHVAAGQELLTADTTQVHHLLASALSKLHQAEDGHKRMLQVYAEGGVTEAQKVDVETALSEAQSLVAGLRKELSDYTLRAPVTGVVDGLDAVVGQSVLPSQQVLTILGMETMNITFSVPEVDIAHVHPGDSGRVTIPALGHQVFPIIVTQRTLEANRITHTYEVKALILGASSSVLPGMVGSVELLSDTQSGFYLPAGCIQTINDHPTVWVAHDGVAERRTIETGAYIRDGVLVTGGLSRGEQVIIEGIQKLWQGAEITY